MQNVASFQTLGLPVIEADHLLYGRAKGTEQILNIPRLIAQGIITTFIFLIIILWFTIALNASTRGYLPSDYYLFQFGVYFTVIALAIILFIIYLITG